MQLEIKKHLFDMLQAAKLLSEFTRGKSFADYEADPLLRAGVERQFEIIGEALVRLSKKSMETVEKISDYRRIVAFRNILIHGYDSISNEIVWEVVQGKLPMLRQEVESLLASG